MARRRIYLMRHGEVRYFSERHPDAEPMLVELTPLGRQQAQAAGRALVGVAFDKVVTSGLPRTIETARLVLAADPDRADVPEIEVWPEFEEFRVPRIEELAEDQVEAAFTTVFHGVPAPDDAYLGGETVRSLVDRVNRELDTLLAQADWQTALLVLHGGVNRVVLSRALAGEPAFFGQLEQSPAGISVLDHGPGWFVRTVNATPLDPAHRGPRTTTIEEVMAEYRKFRGFADVVDRDAER